MNLKQVASLLSIVAALLAAPLFAADVGDVLPAFTLQDAKKNEHTLSRSTRRIYASADRAGDSLLKAALETNGQAMLDAQNAIVVADISDVPFFIKGLVRSGVEDRSYLTWLDENELTRKFIPYREDRITVLDIEQRRIVAVRFVAEIEELKRELATVPKPAPVAPKPKPKPTPAPIAAEDEPSAGEEAEMPSTSEAEADASATDQSADGHEAPMPAPEFTPKEEVTPEGGMSDTSATDQEPPP